MVQIQIAQMDLEVLKSGGYSLCFAKNFSGGGGSPYTVVWWASRAYLLSNTLSWLPQFELFGTNQFANGVQVVVQTNISTIGLGEQCVLDQYGALSEPMTGGPVDGITMIDQFGLIHPGLCQFLMAPDGQQLAIPAFVCENTTVAGQTTTMTPVDKLLVWFQQDVESSTMFANLPSMSIEVDLTMTDSVTLTFANQQWSIG